MFFHRARLNRTFYGIETIAARQDMVGVPGLNRTFYGIETEIRGGYGDAQHRLNRTFYGIETVFPLSFEHRPDVLIVPFMELKPRGARIVGDVLMS